MHASDCFSAFSKALSGHPLEEHRAIFKELLHHHGLNANQPWSEIALSSEITESIDKSLLELNTRKPLQYVLGIAPFYNLDLKVNEHTLIPRPETEELVYIILETNKEEGLRILDIGTGSGCIPVSILSQRPTWAGYGIDISNHALSVANLNAEKYNLQDQLEFITFDILNQSYNLSNIDLLVSNPPYIANSEKSDMSDTVLKFEPKEALFTMSDDPLIFYRRIAQEMSSQKFSGKAYFEINPLYADEICNIFSAYSPRVVKDMQQKNRFLIIN